MSYDATVKWWNDSKGFGFLTLEDGRDVFCHYTQIAGEGFKTLTVGQKVTTDLYETVKGLEAKHVHKA